MQDYRKTKDIDPNSINFQQAIHGAFANVIDMQVTPVSGATGISTTPTLTTKVGDPIDYAHIKATQVQTTGIGNNLPIHFQVVDGNMTASDNAVKLRAGRLYELIGNIPRWAASTTGGISFQFYNSTNNVYIGSVGRQATYSWDGNAHEGGVSVTQIRAEEDIYVQLRMHSINGTITSIGAAGIYPAILAKQLDPRAMHYTWGATQVEVRKKSTGIVVFNSGEVANLSVTLTGSLEASTEYEWRARHKEQAGYWMKWSTWQTFTTV